MNSTFLFLSSNNPLGGKTPSCLPTFPALSSFFCLVVMLPERSEPGNLVPSSHLQCITVDGVKSVSSSLTKMFLINLTRDLDHLWVLHTRCIAVDVVYYSPWLLRLQDARRRVELYSLGPQESTASSQTGLSGTSCSCSIVFSVLSEFCC